MKKTSPVVEIEAVELYPMAAIDISEMIYNTLKCFKPIRYDVEYLELIEDMDYEAYAPIIKKAETQPMLSHDSLFVSAVKFLEYRSNHLELLDYEDTAEERAYELEEELYNLMQANYTLNEYRAYSSYENACGNIENIEILEHLYTPILDKLLYGFEE